MYGGIPSVVKVLNLSRAVLVAAFLRGALAEEAVFFEGVFDTALAGSGSDQWWIVP
jgi:hypothetical protein